jgi:rod shape-determining protein MreC
MGLDQNTTLLARPRAYIDWTLYPIRQLADFPVRTAQTVRAELRGRSSLKKELEQLQSQNLLNAARWQRVEALEAENLRLRALLNSSLQVESRVSIAELTQAALDPYKHLVTINRGSFDGVFLKQPVLDAQGVIGQVYRVSLQDAEVILISDPGHAIPVQLNRTGMRALAFGTGNLNRLELPFIPNNADVREGDLLVTSGLGGGFPAGYPVAKIASVSNDPGRSFALVTAEPTAHLDRFREVLLVWSNENRERNGASSEVKP